MNAPRSVFVLGSASFMVLALAGQAGCVLASPTYVTTHEAAAADGGAALSTSSTSSSMSGAACSNAFAKPDLTKLPACGGGKGHCWDKTKSPSQGTIFEACPGSATDVCVPDEILAAGGEKLKSCTSIIGPGGCVTTSLIPEIKKQGGDALKQDTCNAGQQCVPCVDPLHGNAPTPFCQPVGVYNEPCQAAAGGGGGEAGAPPPPAEACCTTNGRSNGLCMPSASIPEAQRDQTVQDSCKAGNSCVPKALALNKPQRCNAAAGMGVCMDQCFSTMLAIAGAVGFLTQDWCGPTEVCVPCSFVSGQGVPGCS